MKLSRRKFLGAAAAVALPCGLKELTAKETPPGVTGVVSCNWEQDTTDHSDIWFLRVRLDAVVIMEGRLFRSQYRCQPGNRPFTWYFGIEHCNQDIGKYPELRLENAKRAAEFVMSEKLRMMSNALSVMKARTR